MAMASARAMARHGHGQGQGHGKAWPWPWPGMAMASFEARGMLVGLQRPAIHICFRFGPGVGAVCVRLCVCLFVRVCAGSDPSGLRVSEGSRAAQPRWGWGGEGPANVVKFCFWGNYGSKSKTFFIV